MSTAIISPVGEKAYPRVTGKDQARFIGKVVSCVLISVCGGVLALSSDWLLKPIGYVLLAAMFVHAVELQHQVLHHTAFARQRPHRPVGVILGLPMMVSYTEYRVRHLLHHKYLGTERDTEFFQFDTRRRLTLGRFLAALFSYRRWARVGIAIVKCLTKRPYDTSLTSRRMGLRIRAEYSLLGALLTSAVTGSALGESWALVHLWLIPVILAEPLHFLVELPEHIHCETDSPDVFANTRSITGNRFSTWFTNSNNLHVEHHYKMILPMARLTSLHQNLMPREQHRCRTYAEFYGTLLRRLMDRSSA